MFVFLLGSVSMQRFFSIDSAVILISNILLGAVIYFVTTRIINKETYREIQGIIVGRNGKVWLGGGHR